MLELVQDDLWLYITKGSVLFVLFVFITIQAHWS